MWSLGSAFPQDDDEEPQRFVIDLPEPTLPSALKSRPPITSLLPPTSASRATTQGPRKRVQWASEVSKVALIENREELAEMWDTGPDAAEMPVALLTPAPAPVCFVYTSADLIGAVLLVLTCLFLDNLLFVCKREPPSGVFYEMI